MPVSERLEDVGTLTLAFSNGTYVAQLSKVVPFKRPQGMTTVAGVQHATTLLDARKSLIRSSQAHSCQTSPSLGCKVSIQGCLSLLDAKCGSKRCDSSTPEA
jgi:hypothetical protein